VPFLLSIHLSGGKPSTFIMILAHIIPSPQYDHHKLFSTTGIASTLMTKRITFKVSNSSSRQHGRNLIQKREKMKEPDNYNGSLEEVNT